jgi:hypothetical protein
VLRVRRAEAGPRVPRGTAMQVDPMKPKLKPPGDMRLKLKCDVLLSTSASRFILRRYTKVCRFVPVAKAGGSLRTTLESSRISSSSSSAALCVCEHSP